VKRRQFFKALLVLPVLALPKVPKKEQKFREKYNEVFNTVLDANWEMCRYPWHSLHRAERMDALIWRIKAEHKRMAMELAANDN
jgi:hypothetical protein